jgi:hypothetical protein
VGLTRLVIDGLTGSALAVDTLATRHLRRLFEGLDPR